MDPLGSFRYALRDPNEIKQCWVCYKEQSTEVKILHCVKCKIARYCSKECQLQHWPEHKKVCKELNPILTEKLDSFDKKVRKTVRPCLHHPFFNRREISDIPEELKKYAQKIIDVEIGSILDKGEIQAYVKQIGQEIFDEWKVKNNNSEDGKRAVQDVCDWIASHSLFDKDNGAWRADYVEYAWEGIGDDIWRWQA